MRASDPCRGRIGQAMTDASYDGHSADALDDRPGLGEPGLRPAQPWTALDAKERTMTTLPRRAFTFGLPAAAAAATSALPPRTAFAQGQAARAKPLPPAARFRIGRFAITALAAFHYPHLGGMRSAPSIMSM